MNRSNHYTMARALLHPSKKTNRTAISFVAWIGFAVLLDPALSLSSSSSSSCHTATPTERKATSASRSVSSSFAFDESSSSSSYLAATDTARDSNNRNKNVSRRSWLSSSVAAAATAISATTPIKPPPAARAFPNAIKEAKLYADRPKRRGDPPKDLGILPRTTEGVDASETSPRLRTCSGNPNCFSTTGDALLEDRQRYGVDFLIPPWVPPPGDAARPLETVADVLAEYEPGQGGIDGGGFALVKQTDSYLYYQFEALKKGYIDDVEFAVATAKTGGEGGVMVRSASRVGVTDFGVNAIRLNYIGGKLRARGWKIAEITPETHRDYWITANEAREATFDEDRRKMD